MNPLAPLEDPLGTIWAQIGKKVPFWAEEHEKTHPFWEHFSCFSRRKETSVSMILVDPPKYNLY